MQRYAEPPGTRFFGYGSLVNRATHDYPGVVPARLHGWRRAWVHVAVRPVAFLSVAPCPDTEIDGILAEVPRGDWAALDAREFAYARHPVLPTGEAGPISAQVYAVPQPDGQAPSERFPILLSYLDAVVQGFLREWGEKGAARFFATTSGWEAPVLDDRAAPRYPRAQTLSKAETALVNDALRDLGARILRPAG